MASPPLLGRAGDRRDGRARGPARRPGVRRGAAEAVPARQVQAGLAGRAPRVAHRREDEEAAADRARGASTARSSATAPGVGCAHGKIRRFCSASNAVPPRHAEAPVPEVQPVPARQAQGELRRRCSPARTARSRRSARRARRCEHGNAKNGCARCRAARAGAAPGTGGYSRGKSARTAKKVGSSRSGALGMPARENPRSRSKCRSHPAPSVEKGLREVRGVPSRTGASRACAQCRPAPARRRARRDCVACQGACPHGKVRRSLRAVRKENRPGESRRRPRAGEARRRERQPRRRRRRRRARTGFPRVPGPAPAKDGECDACHRERIARLLGALRDQSDKSATSATSAETRRDTNGSAPKRRRGGNA